MTKFITKLCAEIALRVNTSNFITFCVGKNVSKYYISVIAASNLNYIVKN